MKKRIEEIIQDIKDQISNNKNIEPYDGDASSWTYEEGVLLSDNEALLLISQLSANRVVSDEEIERLSLAKSNPESPPVCKNQSSCTIKKSEGITCLSSEPCYVDNIVLPDYTREEIINIITPRLTNWLRSQLKPSTSQEWVSVEKLRSQFRKETNTKRPLTRTHEAYAFYWSKYCQWLERQLLPEQQKEMQESPQDQQTQSDIKYPNWDKMWGNLRKRLDKDNSNSYYFIENSDNQQWLHYSEKRFTNNPQQALQFDDKATANLYLTLCHNRGELINCVVTEHSN